MSGEVWVCGTGKTKKEGGLFETHFQRPNRIEALPCGSIVLPTSDNLVFVISADGKMTTLKQDRGKSTPNDEPQHYLFEHAFCAFSDRKGGFYLGESETDQIYHVTKNMVVTKALEPPTTGHDWRMLYGAALAPNGDIYLSEGAFGKLIIYESFQQSRSLGWGIGQPADGVDASIGFYCPSDICWTDYGDCFIGDHTTVKLLTKQLISGEWQFSLTTFLGTPTAGYRDGPRSQATFNGICDLGFLPRGGGMLIGDQMNGAVRLLNHLNMVSTVLIMHQLSSPEQGCMGFCLNLAGDLIASDTYRHRLIIKRKFDIPTPEMDLSALENDCAPSTLVHHQLASLAYPWIKEYNEIPISGVNLPEASIQALKALLYSNRYSDDPLTLLHMIEALRNLGCPSCPLLDDCIARFARRLLYLSSAGIDHLLAYCELSLDGRLKDMASLAHQNVSLFSPDNLKYDPSAVFQWDSSNLLSYCHPDMVLRYRGSAHLCESLDQLYTALMAPESIPQRFSEIPCDFEIISEGQSLQVHSWILSARWPWFRRMMQSGFSEAQSHTLTLSVDSWSYLQLRALVQFLYSNRLNDIQRDLQFCSSLWHSAEFFGLIDADKEALTPFAPLVYHLRMTIAELTQEAPN
jgi:hypothetical protein